MNKVFLISAKRTAIGSFLGSLKGVSPSDLAVPLVKNILEETKIDPKDVDEVIVGNVLSAGHSQGIGRQVAIKAGIPYTVPAYSINIICGSGMKSVMTAFNNIRVGEADLIFAGGTESMSQAPFLLNNNLRSGIKMGESILKDHMILDALTDAFNNVHMGVTAENIAKKYSISREEQDNFALASQKKAIAAIDSGKFKDEIIPLEIKLKKETIIFDTDEYPNRKTNAEKLSKLKPAFVPNGTVTAGNSSGINDGASMVLIASEKAIKKYNLKPMAEIIAIGQGGVDPLYMGLGPVPAIIDVFSKVDFSLKDINLIELNEAFSSQSLGVIRELCQHFNIEKKWFDDKLNVNGGAIALGHPVGASGNRIITTLVHEMKKQNAKYGLASLCIGGGMGTAVILKNI